MRDARVVRFTIGRDGYPERLRDLPDAPAALFARGAACELDRDAVAIVGSRAATAYGTAFAERLAADLGRLGLVVVSGLARGIDAAAHEGALEAGGRTVAVLPGGLDPVHPVHHASLAERIARHGALAAEDPPGSAVFRGSFVRRNRLIAALGTVTVVVEAAERSGSLLTADRARRLGRPVLAVPGDLDRPSSAGSNRLLRHGARPCLEARDVLDAMPGATDPPPGCGGASGPEDALLRRLDRGPCGTEDLAAAAGLPLPSLLGRLLALEWAGLIERLAGQRWRRRR
jgi:DNA processing protein